MAYKLTLELEDEKGNIKQPYFQLEEGASPADDQAAAAAFAALYAKVTDCAVNNATLTKTITLPATGFTPVAVTAGARMWKTGRVKVGLNPGAGSIQTKATIRIPSIKSDFLNTSNSVIDNGSGDLAAMLAAMDASSGKVRVSDGQSVTGLLGGKGYNEAHDGDDA